MATALDSTPQHHLKRSLQSKFAAANEEPVVAGDELWQSRDAPKATLPVIILPAPTDIAILRRYADEAQKQHVRGHIAQVYHAARILVYAVIGLALSCLIVGIGMPAKWALSLLDRISRQREAVMASLKESVTGERAQALLSYVEALSLYLLELAERVTGRKGLADRARQTASQTKAQLVTRVTELEGEVQKKKEQLLTSIANGKQELRDREAGVSGVVRQQRAELVRTVQHGAKEVVTVVSPLRSGLQVKRRVNEFIAVANIMVQTAFAVTLILVLLPRNILAAAIGRPAPVVAQTTMPETLKKTE